jgi:hypothetical protein
MGKPKAAEPFNRLARAAGDASLALQDLYRAVGEADSGVARQLDSHGRIIEPRSGRPGRAGPQETQ